MATHYLLKLHFCTFCGAHGAKRSYRLQAPCPPCPPKAGREALRLISKGFRPDVHKASFEERRGRQVFNPQGKKRPVKAFWRQSWNSRKNRKRVKDSASSQADPLGPPCFSLKGPKAAPGPVTLQASDFRFLEEHKSPVNPGGASHPGTPNGKTGPAGEPVHFSAAFASSAQFSGSQARISSDEAVTLQSCPPPPNGNWPRRARRFQPYHAVCSQHGRGGSWSIANFCQECDGIAVEAVNRA